MAVNKSEKLIIQNNVKEKIREVELAVVYLGMALQELDRKGMKMTKTDIVRLRDLTKTFEEYIK